MLRSSMSAACINRQLFANTHCMCKFFRLIIKLFQFIMFTLANYLFRREVILFRFVLSRQQQVMYLSCQCDLQQKLQNHFLGVVSLLSLPW